MIHEREGAQMVEVGRSRLRRAMEHTQTHVGEWDQANWGKDSPCGTAFCLFGQGVNQEGAQFAPSRSLFSRFDYEFVARDSLPTGLRLPWGSDLSEEGDRVVDGRLYISTFLAGAALFGLDMSDAESLSAGSNDMETLCRLTARILDEPWRSPWHAVTVDAGRAFFRHGPECAAYSCVLKWYVYDTVECSEENIEAPWEGDGEVRVITHPDGSHELEWRHASEIGSSNSPMPREPAPHRLSGARVRRQLDWEER